jgi:hypothetical protein
MLAQRSFLSFKITVFCGYKLSTLMFGKKTEEENTIIENKNIYF